MSEARPLSLSRLENLADGVFAFAMTILVLGLGVDEAFALLEAGDVRAGLATMAPRFLTLVFGLFGLGAFWVAHNVLFRQVKDVDRNLIYLNLAAFLFIILLPFSIALWGRRWHDAWAILVVVLNLGALNAGLALQFAYNARRRRILGDPVPAPTLRRAKVAFLLPYAFWVVVAALGFVSPVASVAVFVASTFAYAVPGASRVFLRTRT